MTRLRFLTVWIFVLPIFGFRASAQDSLYARRVIETLTSPEFHGRGYAFHGDSIAARFISAEFSRLQLKKWTNNYYQSYNNFSINVFEGHTKVDFGKNYPSSSQSDAMQIIPYSAETKGKFRIVSANDKMLKDTNAFKLNDKFVLVDMLKFTLVDTVKLGQNITFNEKEDQWRKIIRRNSLNAKGYIVLNEKLGAYSPISGRTKSSHTTIYLLKDSVSGSLKKASIDLDARFIENYQTQNICGYVEGKLYPDTFFVFGAHYDHLGQIGESYYFPGANDNAAGVAMVMDLARHYSLPENRPDYSMVFIAFSGEEIGLLGSSHFVENAPFPLENVKMMLNLDVMGSGEDGFTFVCGQVFPEEFEKFARINEEKNYAPKLLAREASSNSDHAPFYKKGCKAMFIYGMGKTGKYHHPSDTLENLSLGGYNSLFRLIVDYIKLHDTP